MTTQEAVRKVQPQAESKRRWWVRALCWGIFLLYFGLVWAATVQQIYETGTIPPDFSTYQSASNAIARGDSPYLSVTETQDMWREITSLRAEVRAETPEAFQLVGPYIYLPTLALTIERFGSGSAAFNAAVMTTLLVGSIIGFCALWIHIGGNHAAWLLFAMLSVEPLSLIGQGNIEGLLILSSLIACWAIWRGYSLLAAPLIAFAVLIKPFFALLFAAYGLVLLANRRRDIHTDFRTLALAAGGSLVLISLDIAFWGGSRQAAAWAYVSNSLDYTWYALPADNQYPLSVWNRTAMQGFVLAGINAGTAQLLGILTGSGLLFIVLWRTRGIPLTFSITFALALLLFYWARPVGWGFTFLEIVLVTVVWPVMRRWERVALIVSLITLMLARWITVGLTDTGATLNLFTLHTEAFPWEIWLLLPLSLALLLLAASRMATTPPTSAKDQGILRL